MTAASAEIRREGMGMAATTLEKKRAPHTAFKLNITDYASQYSSRVATPSAIARTGCGRLSLQPRPHCLVDVLPMRNAVEKKNTSSPLLATLLLYSVQTIMHVCVYLEW